MLGHKIRPQDDLRGPQYASRDKLRQLAPGRGLTTAPSSSRTSRRVRCCARSCCRRAGPLQHAGLNPPLQSPAPCTRRPPPFPRAPTVRCLPPPLPSSPSFPPPFLVPSFCIFFSLAVLQISSTDNSFNLTRHPLVISSKRGIIIFGQFIK